MLLDVFHAYYHDLVSELGVYFLHDIYEVYQGSIDALLPRFFLSPFSGSLGARLLGYVISHHIFDGGARWVLDRGTFSVTETPNSSHPLSEGEGRADIQAASLGFTGVLYLHDLIHFFLQLIHPRKF